MAAERGRIEPAPRRVRGFVDGALVFDTTAARYVWEVAYYPQYYIPVVDVEMQYLHDEHHVQTVQFGDFRLFTLTTAHRTQPSTARVYDSGALAGFVRFDWGAVDWFEEEQPLVGHPRSPYVRVDALRSNRHIRVEIDGVSLAETSSPVLLFETGLPTRYYIDRTDIAFAHLEPSPTQSICPYKGITSGYWSVRVGESLYPDLAWTYDAPMPAVTPIAQTIAFYNESVDIYVDDVLVPRPRTHFT